MSDDPQRPHEPQGDGTSLDGMSESDLDSLLAQASALADDVADEVGPAPADDVPDSAGFEGGSVEDPLASVPANEQAALDTQIAKLDGLAQMTSAELGGPDDLDGDQSGVVESSPAPDAIPDFMREFTEPEPEPQAECDAAGAPPADGADSTPDVAQTSALGELREAVPPKDANASLPQTGLDGDSHAHDGHDEVSMAAAESESTAATKAPAALKAATSIALTHVGRVGVIAAGGGATALEVLDRPFSRASERIKRLLGWIAIATTLTALVALSVSMA